MDRPEYWRWIKRIWNAPTDAHLRRVFADWLDERGCAGAAKRQRQYAEWVEATMTMYRVVDFEQVYLWVQHKRHYRMMRMKKDGTIHPMSVHHMQWHGPGTQIEYLKRTK